ncbi:iron-containing redox enzyme family protein [Microbacterium sp. Marseille-Q6965]|uniref:iron-containing redox enzyme family protein n=1 Tax=Microbacterium sp. Marseille-Q6965 TaxID=2965072 RepID=UPI0021B76DAE|nr:iron-containing redox enzyme family protein [Microbacterium sp. Marseille-Q6965]
MTILSSTAAPSLGFHDRGPLSRTVRERIIAVDKGHAPPARELDDAVSEALERASDVVTDDDVQLALFLLYGSAYGSFGSFGVHSEWDPVLLTARARLERAFEARVRELTPPVPTPDPSTADGIAAVLFELTAPQPSPGLARFVEKQADAEQIREMLVLRSIYTLREADPHSWAIPRLTGRPKVALVEIQSDEYGGGRPERMHATLYAAAMRGAGLEDRYGAYVDAVPAVTLAAQNMMSMFGLNRRLLGAIVGHLAAFEMTSSLPNRRYADGMRRVGFGPEVTEYFDEHVEADAVHEQIAGRDLAGRLGEEHPELLPDILFGAAACLAVDDLVADHVLAAWRSGGSALRAAEAATP